MSDEDEYEYEYEYDDDDDDAGGEQMDEDNPFEYTDDEGSQDDAAVALENAYYNAKGLRETDLNQAADAFRETVQQELETGHYGPWSFKSMKQLVKLYLRQGKDQETVDSYRKLLDCISTGKDVSPNAVEKGIHGMLERVAAAQSSQTALSVYDLTLQTFHPRTGACPNERLWFKANLKYGQLLYEIHETDKLQKVLADLESLTSHASSSMEIYALQIQLYSRQKDHKKLRDTFTRAMAIQGGIPHPRTLALMQEAGGKMHMAAKEYEAAGKNFFQAFKSYDEAGDPARLRCLKYLVLASMLHASTINPFDSQEARPYRDDPEILAMPNLVQAFHNNEIQTFEKILRQGRIMEDEFVAEHMEDLLRTIRTQVLRRVIQPYKRISLQAIAKELNDIPVKDVESLLVSLILQGSLDGRIDQVKGILWQNKEAIDEEEKESDQAMNSIMDRLEGLSNVITSIRSSGNKSGTGMRGQMAWSEPGEAFMHQG